MHGVMFRLFGLFVWFLVLANSELMVFAQSEKSTEPSSEPSIKEEINDGTEPSPPEPRASDPPSKPERLSVPRQQWEDTQRQLAELRRATPPSRLSLSATVTGAQAGSVIRIRAIFTGRTREPNQLVSLDLRDAKTVSASLDTDEMESRLPELVSGSEGRLSALIEQPGNYKLTLDLEVPLNVRGSELGYELHLPGSAITVLSQEPIARVSSYRIGTRLGDEMTLDERRVEGERLKPNQGSDPGGVPVGAARVLNVSWELPDPPANVPGPSPASTGRARVDVEVRVTAEDVRTSAELQLNGPTKEWRILAPADANLKVEPAPPKPRDTADGTVPMPEPFTAPPRVTAPQGGTSPKPGIWVIQFNEAPKTDFVVTVTIPPRPLIDKDKRRSPIPIGPIEVQDVFPQAGDYLVLAPANLRVDVEHPVSVQRSSDQSKGLADRPELATLLPMRFQYVAPPRDPKGKAISPLTLLVRPLAGRVLSQTSQRLELGQEGWHLITEIRLKPIRTDVGHIDLWIPNELQNLQAESPDPALTDGGFVQIGDDQTDGEGMHRRVQFDRARSEPVTLLLRGVYPMKLTDRSVHLNLPRILSTFEQGGKVSAEIPAGIELRGIVREWADGRIARLPFPLIEGRNQSTSDNSRPTDPNRVYETTLNRAPAETELLWGPKIEETEVSSVIDMYLQQGQIEIRQLFTFPNGRPRMLRLVGSKDLRGLRQSQGRGQVSTLTAGDWAVFSGTGDGARSTDEGDDLELIYSFPLNEEGGHLELPILRPAGARGQVRVRVWRGGSGLRPELVSSMAEQWQTRPTEVIPGERGLPSMVLVGTLNSIREPLELNLASDQTGSRPAVRVERSLILTYDDGEGRQIYRAYFRLSHWEGETIAVTLPGGAALRDPVFTLHGHQADVGALPNGSFLVRVGKCDLKSRESAILAIRYRLDRSAGGGAIGRWAGWQVRLEPPLLQGSAFDLPTLWQIGMPAGDVPIYLGEEVTFRSRLAWHRGLLRAEAGRSSQDAFDWLNEGMDNSRESTLEWTLDGWNTDAATLSAHQADPDVIRLTLVGRPWWLVCCSLTVMLVGLLLWRFPSWLFWGSICLSGVALGALALGWQQAAGQLLCGAQIGVTVLTVVLVVRWLVKRYHRRRVVFMSGFSRTPVASRTHSDSSLNGKRRPRELVETGSVSESSRPVPPSGTGSPWSTEPSDES